MRTAFLGIPPRNTEADVTIVSQLADARRLRSEDPRRLVVAADTRLPFRDGVLSAIWDERARDSAAVLESARVLGAGGRLVVSAAAASHSGPGSILGGVLGWKRRRTFVRRQDWSAWFLAAGFCDICQRELERPVHTIRTEGIARKLPPVTGAGP